MSFLTQDQLDRLARMKPANRKVFKELYLKLNLKELGGEPEYKDKR